MIVVGPADLEAYLARDPILARLQASPAPFASHRWLVEAPAKRLIFELLYGDLLDGPRRRVADIGGGVTGLTRALAAAHDYALVNLLVHDDVAAVRALEHGAPFVHATDWYALAPASYDVVVANDLFPNVDQRLALFLDRFLPRCRELRLSLTYHNTPRFHAVRRLDGDEQLTMLAWTGRDVARVLAELGDRVDGPVPDLTLDRPSLFANGRQVIVVTVRGDG